MICKDGSTFSPEQTDLIQWEKTYPKTDVYQELMAMESWLDANPSRRKTKGGMKRFINTWLKRANENGGSPMAKAKSQSSRAISIEDKLADVGWVQNQETKQGAINLFLAKYGFYFDGEVRHEKAKDTVQG